MRILGRRLSAAGAIGLAIIVLNLAAALLAPVIAPHGEADPLGPVWGAATAEFPLGLDGLGRDLLSRLLYGARTSILLALAITAISFAVGGIAGFTAAIAGGKVDMLLSRFVDVLMAIPTLILALIVLTVMGTSIPALIGTIALLDATRVFRISRAVATDIAVMEYVEVARLRGEGLGWIMRREILPNALPPLAAEFGLRFCYAFLFVAALSFLGLGVQPPAADWGSMVRENAPAINYGLPAPLIPAAAIALLTIGVNLVVDWFVSVHTSPRSRET